MTAPAPSPSADAVEAARPSLDMTQPHLWISMGRKVLRGHPSPCPTGECCTVTPTFWLRVEAASIALDLAIAEHIALRRARREAGR